MANNNSLALARGFQTQIEKSVDASRLEESQNTLKKNQTEGDPSELTDRNGDMEVHIRTRRNTLITRVIDGNSSVINTVNGGRSNHFPIPDYIISGVSKSWTSN